MRSISKYLTPYKLGKPVLTGSGQQRKFDFLAVDAPFVFYHQNQFHMLYIGFDGTGYQTGLAVSEDLINWKSKGVVLNRKEQGWDRVGAAGTWIIKSSDCLYDLPHLKKINGKYWMVYHSYPGKGYEIGPAEMGLAWTEDEDLMEWHRLPYPVYSWRGGESWEEGGLYKACIIEDSGTYYMFYNAKNKTPGSTWQEQIGVAFSQDLLHWKRFAENPVVRINEGTWDSKLCADPCVYHDGDRWVMYYFGYDYKHAQNGIAFSDDLLHWEKWPEPVLRYGVPGSLDEIHAHKPAMIHYGGVLYHFYCACRKYREGDPAKYGEEFRCISLATSSLRR